MHDVIRNNEYENLSTYQWKGLVCEGRIHYTYKVAFSLLYLVSLSPLVVGLAIDEFLRKQEQNKNVLVVVILMFNPSSPEHFSRTYFSKGVGKYNVTMTS